ncbi:MAG: exodeoxyribonuclease VII large subunit [Bryobacterales bacterium]|nr:exodeoxyribonuclease VII large subunit [Bryobacterales bacterium]
MEQISFDLSPPRQQFTVSELNARVRSLLTGTFSNIWVQGEISGCKTFSSGHCYFTMKDAQSQVRCVAFRGDLRFFRLKPADGMAVLARGRLDVFEQRGEYQLIVEAMEPYGRADLYLSFEQLKNRLAAEGLFESDRKRPLPRYPRRIGIVTSPTGAVIRDMVSILRRRWPGVHIRLFPAQVQGAGSVEAVVSGIRYFTRHPWAEVLIVGRGGGSLEDLWTFNEEAVARAIAGSQVPVISAVGHETDFTIADFVADLRAPTPSAAAELVVQRKDELLQRVESLVQHMRRAAHLKISRRAQRIDELDRCLRGPLIAGVNSRRRKLASFVQRLQRQDPTVRLGDARRRLIEAATQLAPLVNQAVEGGRRRLESSDPRLEHAVTLRIERLRRRLEPLASALHQLSPERVLDRGYSIVQTAEGKVVRDAARTEIGDRLAVRLSRGKLEVAVVTKTE